MHGVSFPLKSEHNESNGPSDAYVAISNADRLQAEPESLRKWREEQSERLEQLDANSRKQEVEWKEKAKLELEEWHTRQNEQLEKTKAIQYVDEFGSSSELVWRNLALRHLLTNGSSAQAKLFIHQFKHMNFKLAASGQNPLSTQNIVHSKKKRLIYTA
uniref:Clathrin light chain n=1 Tax=Sinocyclocheilus anshuiensis TaxID=1608454 RepID=A0A671RM97_9TELE